MSLETPRKVKLPGQRRRQLAKQLLNAHPLHSSPISPSSPSPGSEYRIRVVCVADTHNHQPELPPGDLLIHAGDLSENGSFDEIQAQLTWLSSQPHQYKIVVSGNHDALLNGDFLQKNPERRYGETKTLRDLNWGDIQFLQDSSTTSEFTFDNSSTGAGSPIKSLAIYGSPWTPAYMLSGFLYSDFAGLSTGWILSSHRKPLVPSYT